MWGPPVFKNMYFLNKDKSETKLMKIVLSLIKIPKTKDTVLSSWLITYRKKMFMSRQNTIQMHLCAVLGSLRLWFDSKHASALSKSAFPGVLMQKSGLENTLNLPPCSISVVVVSPLHSSHWDVLNEAKFSFFWHKKIMRNVFSCLIKSFLV